MSMLRVNNSQLAISIEIHTPCVKILTVDLPQGVYGFQMEQSVHVAHNLIPKLGRLIDYSSISKMYPFIHITVIFQMLQWSINYTNSGLTLPVTAKCNESEQITLVLFYITLWFCRVGQILLILGEKKIVFENVTVCWHNTRPIFCFQACTLVYFVSS